MESLTTATFCAVLNMTKNWNKSLILAVKNWTLVVMEVTNNMEGKIVIVERFLVKNNINNGAN